MPSIKITDQLSAEVDVELNEASAIAKYIKDLRSLKLPNVKFSVLENVTLDKTPVKNLETGLSFPPTARSSASCSSRASSSRPSTVAARSSFSRPS